ncbi:hypothetical protein C8F04DRAFT_1261393 [Mycena alexandri]|uniref:Uncharacterized protein n=1 Tax=Mycena alexandri TaxID=1745969 RepID=A0AAD6X1F1_9AGAR|nr:hypothetical protein C8F04DRAFT_1261393 [Mycena alexandri]
MCSSAANWRVRISHTSLLPAYVSIKSILTTHHPQPTPTGSSPSNTASGSRTTRSGTQFSPYELSTIDINGRQFGIIRTSASLDPVLREALIAADRRAAQRDAFEGGQAYDDDGWEDEDDVELESSSAPPSPLSSTPSTPLSSAPSSPLSSPPSTRPPSPAAAAPSPLRSNIGIEAQRKKIKAADRRRTKRQRRAAAGPYERGLAARNLQTYRQQPAHRVALDASSLPAAGGGAWIGRRSKPTRRILTLPELDAMDCEVVEWNGRDPKLIVDAEGRIIAVLLGQPDDPEWEDVIQRASKALERARRSAVRHGLWRPGDSHRRGRHVSFGGGASFGGGQRRPGNLRQNRHTRRILLKLLRNRYIRRIMGFQSCLFEHHLDLIHLFDNSIFPAATFNCGPDAVTFDHCDFLNLPHGLCPVTAGGHFDHKLGGHIYLKQLRLVIQFPSGATIAIPSGCVDHGNTPIQPGETRHSITQYAAGGLFRWAGYGYHSAKALSATEEGRKVKAAADGEPGARWEWAMGLFSKLNKLDADRAEVFGSRVSS